MMRKLAGLSLLALAALALAGCAGDSGEAAKLTYEGNDIGAHDESADCDDDATLVADGNVDQGQVEITVTDGDGDEVFSETFSEGEGMEMEGEMLEGASGEWTLAAVRMNDALVDSEGFDGEYTVRLTC
jgi:hypothetical protein